MTTDQELLTTAYRAFNVRDLEAALAAMHPEVEWPNTMEGGYVHGHDGVSAYCGNAMIGVSSGTWLIPTSNLSGLKRTRTGALPSKCIKWYMTCKAIYSKT